MALPQVTEQDHHGIPSFRVSGKIFATVPDEDHLRIMLDEHAIRAAAYENPDVYHEFYWGKRLACLLVDLGGVTQQQLSELLTEAWLDKAPPSLSLPASIRRPRPVASAALRAALAKAEPFLPGTTFHIESICCMVLLMHPQDQFRHRK